MCNRRHGSIGILFFIFTFLFTEITIAQVVVTGPTCVTTTVSYQYNISGPWTSKSTFQVCVTGGVLVSTNTTCFSGTPISFIRVNWTDGMATGHIVITTDSGNASLDISISKPFDGGSIDSTLRFQKTLSGRTPTTIICSMPSGGNCSPTYIYQWQQSYDMMEWSDISGSTNQNLRFGKPNTDIIYYRRKVTETRSGAIAYSTTATLAN